MNTITTTASSALAAEPVASEKLFNYLIRTATEECSSPEDFIRKLVEVTLAHAAKAKRSNGQSLATQYAEAESPLLARIYAARPVMLNTLKKLINWYDKAPEGFDWVRTRGPVVITGIYRGSAKDGKTMTNITVQISEGKLALQPTDMVMFTTIGDSYYGRPEVAGIKGSLTVAELNNDPIALSQKVRRAVKADRHKKVEAEQKAERVEEVALLKTVEEAQARLLLIQEEKVHNAAKVARLKKAEEKRKAERAQESELLRTVREAKERLPQIQQAQKARAAKEAKEKAKKESDAAYRAKQVS